jgi:hypothetical protein
LARDGLPLAPYARVRAAVHLDAAPPAGVRYHPAAFDDRGARRTDVGASAEPFQAFGDPRLLPAIQQLGLPGAPKRWRTVPLGAADTAAGTLVRPSSGAALGGAPAGAGSLPGAPPSEPRPRSTRWGHGRWYSGWHAVAGKGAESVMDEADWESLWNRYRRSRGASGASAPDTDHQTPAWFRERLEGMDPDARRLRLWQLVRDEFLSEEALAKGYGLANVRPFLDFLKDELGQDV